MDHLRLRARLRPRAHPRRPHRRPHRPQVGVHRRPRDLHAREPRGPASRTTRRRSIVARVVQGLGGGIFFPPVTAFIQLLFPAGARARRSRSWAPSSASRRRSARSSAACSSRRSATTSGWRSIFFVNLPFGVIAVIAALILLPEGAEGKQRAARTSSVWCCSPAVWSRSSCRSIQGQDEGWPLWTYLSIGGGVVLLVLFALWERNVDRARQEPARAAAPVLARRRSPAA